MNRSPKGWRAAVPIAALLMLALHCRGKTTLHSEPAPAEVRDAQGKVLGKTPMQVEVPSGGHTYRLVHPDYAPTPVSLKPEDGTKSVKLMTWLEARSDRAYYHGSEWTIYDNLQGDFRYRETAWIAADGKMTVKSPEDPSASFVRWEILGGAVWRVGNDPDTRLDFVLHNKKEDRFFSRGGQYFIQRKK